MGAKSNRVREGTGRRFQGRRKGKEKSFCFVVIQFELIFRHPCFYVVCACTEFFGEVGHFTERSGFLELCVICEKQLSCFNQCVLGLSGLLGLNAVIILPFYCNAIIAWRCFSFFS